MAGIKTLHYVDIKKVATFMPSGEGMSITLAQGAAWSKVLFSEASCNTVLEGDAFSHIVNATVPGKGKVSARDLMELCYGRYIVKATDNNGVSWLIGDTEEGLRFAFEDVNEGTAEGETAYRLTFSGLSMWPQMKNM